ncbi:MAG: cobalt-precorrin-5B (C(1))-methyltransferase CbiD [Firmicutes bacterium]|nr:cobalt-precorrin-5B (C(1))-methyltransferase CbiD [Bacillota bacterium]
MILLDRYVVKNGKKLRYGYTTGSCASAATLAAILTLKSKEAVEEVMIHTPKGWDIRIESEIVSLDINSCTAYVVKDSGDDPDVTNGVKIYSKVTLRDDKNRNIYGGVGVGKVTRKGLSVEVGSSAINPVPMEMIKNVLDEHLPDDLGVDVEIYCPEGVEIGKKTFNPRLGIEGGISIIGTTGIVEPMSLEALKDSIVIELKYLKENGYNKVIFSPGNYGRDKLIEMGFDQELLVKTSNFLGYMLEQAEYYGFEKVLWIGHIGKMVKLSGGIYDSHSKNADGRMEILTCHAALLGADKELLNQIFKSITTDEAISYIKEKMDDEIFSVLSNKIVENSKHRFSGEVEALIFSKEHGILGSSKGFNNLSKEFFNEKS